MSENWTVSDLTKYLNVSRHTIQRRADHFLGPRPTGNGERTFSPSDVALMVEVHQMVKVSPGASFEAIDTNLDRAQFESVNHFPAMGQAQEIIEGHLLQIEARAQAMLAQYTEKIDSLQGQLDSKEAELMEARLTIARLEERVKIFAEQGNADEVRRLIAEVARLQVLLELEQSKHKGD